jgi:hypothetical protein
MDGEISLRLKLVPRFLDAPISGAISLQLNGMLKLISQLFLCRMTSTFVQMQREVSEASQMSAYAERQPVER